LISWVTVPLWKFSKYLASSPRLDRVRNRACVVTGLIAAAFFVLLGVVPFPNHFRASGVVKTTERSGIANETAGALNELLAKPGQAVVKGQPLLALVNRELDLELAHSTARLDEVEARRGKATKEGSADLLPLDRLRASIQTRIVKLKEDRENLVVKARHDGIWVAPGIEDYKGRWIPRGSNLGLLVNPAQFEFTATVLQVDVDALFKKNLRGAEIRLYGQADQVLPVHDWLVIPGEQKILPSPVLGWRAGGDIPVEAEDRNGNQSAEPFFEVICKLGPSALDPALALRDGRSGKIRFNLEPEPLLPRWFRRLRQLLQQRYEM
jgi:putative peptide zinc metalloprotease protein